MGTNLHGLLIKTAILVLMMVLPGQAMGADTGLGLPEMSFKVGQGEGLSTTIRIIILMTVLTLLPAIALMMTSFTRFIIVFSLLRHAMGLQQTPPNQVLIGIALFMTFFVMTPVFDEVYTDALDPYMNHGMNEKEAFAKGMEPFRKFMLAQTKEKELALFVEMSGDKRPSSPEDVRTSVLIPAFITSELKSAFQIGFILFIPFLIIDMVVASVLMSMGMFMLPPVLISLPFKIMLFVLVDGWALLIGSMIRSFNV